MARLIPCGRDRALLLPLVVVATVGRMPAGAVAVRPIPGGRAQDRPRRPLALPISRRASGIFSSRRIERATHRDRGVRYVAANLHPDHDTLAAFCRTRPRRPHDFRPGHAEDPARSAEPWRPAMPARLGTPDAKARCARRKQTAEPAFGIVKATPASPDLGHGPPCTCTGRRRKSDRLLAGYAPPQPVRKRSSRVPIRPTL
ncbi:hypothetical protein [Caldovatus sediminis]